MNELLVILLIAGIVLVLLGVSMGGVHQVLSCLDLEKEPEQRNEAIDSMFRKDENA